MEKKEKKQVFTSKTIKIATIIIAAFMLVGVTSGVVHFTAKIQKISTVILTDQSLKLYQEASRKYLQKDLNACIELFTQLIKKEKKFINGYFMLGKAHFFNDQPDLAEKTWLRALKINPYHIDTLIWLGKLYSYDKDKENEAVKLFNRVLSIDSLNIQANYSLAKMNYNSGDLKKAITYFNNALENELHLAEIHLDMAKLYQTVDYKERARQELIRAKNLNRSKATLKEIEALEKQINKGD